METVTIQDLIDRHMKGAAECEAYAATDMPDKGNAKTYRDRAEWHKAAAALLQSVPTTVDLANADADGFRNGRASVVVELATITVDLSEAREEAAKGCGGSDMGDAVLAAAIKAIIAAGGSVKE